MIVLVPGLFRNLPQPALAAVVITASLSLAAIPGTMRLWRQRKAEFLLAIAAVKAFRQETGAGSRRAHYHPAMGDPPRRCRCFNCVMVVIFGFGPGKQEDLGEAVQTVCPNCNNQVVLHHVRSKKSVRLYFVPVVPYGTDDYLVCPICSRGLQLSHAQLPHLAPMKRATASFRAGRLSEADYAAQAELFWRAMGVNVAGRPVTAGSPAAAAPVPTAPPPAPAPAAGSATAARPPPAANEETSWLSQLRKLAQLHEEGVLSDAHYETAKRRILDQK